MTVTVELKSKRSSSTVWLEVTYSGLRPPISLFDDLEMVGWTPPAIPPPPASAIDWTRPDPTTGQPFTIEDYLVEGAVVTPPRGSGPLGRWTDADRRTHFAVLEGVLKRHGLLDQVKEGRSGVATPPPAPAPPGAVRITAAIPPAAEAATTAALAGWGVDQVRLAPVHRTVVHRYRGAEHAQQVLDHVRLEAVVPSSELEAVKAAIAGAASAAGQPPPDVVVASSPEPPAAEPEATAGHPTPRLRAVTETRSA